MNKTIDSNISALKRKRIAVDSTVSSNKKQQGGIGNSFLSITLHRMVISNPKEGTVAMILNSRVRDWFEMPSQWIMNRSLTKIDSGRHGVIFKSSMQLNENGEKITIALKKIPIKNERDKKKTYTECVNQIQAYTACEKNTNNAKIPKIYGMFDVPGKHGINRYIVMEFLDAKSWNETIKSRADSDHEMLIREIESSGQCVANAGISHNDLSHSNIKFAYKDGKWQPYILDFGESSKFEADKVEANRSWSQDIRYLRHKIKEAGYN